MTSLMRQLRVQRQPPHFLHANDPSCINICQKVTQIRPYLLQQMRVDPSDRRQLWLHWRCLMEGMHASVTLYSVLHVVPAMINALQQSTISAKCFRY